MNVALGGSLYRDLYNCGVTEAQHRQNPPYYGISHQVTIAKGSLLESVVSPSGDFEVNSMHHQGVDHVAPGLLVAARSEDRVVEAVEDPAKPFFLGVQWHPEYLDHHHGLFNALAAAAHQFQRRGRCRALTFSACKRPHLLIRVTTTSLEEYFAANWTN